MRSLASPRRRQEPSGEKRDVVDARGGRSSDRPPRDWSDAVLDRFELDVLAGTCDGDRLQQADARPIELVLVLRLEQRVVLRLQNVSREAPEWNRSGCADTEHLGRVLRGARSILLAVDVSDLRRRLHVVARLRAVDAGGPATVMRAGRQLGRKPAEVPDVALVVLPVPIQGVLCRDAALE